VLYVASERVDLAEVVLRRSISVFADDAKAHFNLVRVLTRLGKRDEARRLYDQARLRFPDYDASDASASRPLH
jgi:Flp pilus assembly protein TadD